MKTTVIFDLAETYLKGFWGVQERLAPLIGRPAQEIYSLLEGEELWKLFRGDINEDAYWEGVVKKNSWNIPIETLKQKVRENFEEIPGTRQLIEDVKGRGYRVGLLSVHAREWIVYCNERYDYHKLFDAIEYSFDHGLLKHEPLAYLLILAKLKSRPEETLFVDDSTKNLATAASLGISPVLFQDAIQARKTLAEILQDEALLNGKA